MTAATTHHPRRTTSTAVALGAVLALALGGCAVADRNEAADLVATACRAYREYLDADDLGSQQRLLKQAVAAGDRASALDSAHLALATDLHTQLDASERFLELTGDARSPLDLFDPDIDRAVDTMASSGEAIALACQQGPGIVVR